MNRYSFLEFILFIGILASAFLIAYSGLIDFKFFFFFGIGLFILFSYMGCKAINWEYEDRLKELKKIENFSKFLHQYKMENEK